VGLCLKATRNNTRARKMENRPVKAAAAIRQHVAEVTVSRGPAHSQYCHLSKSSTYAASKPLVTAWARMQSARLRVRTIHQL